MSALFLRPDADQSDGSWLNEAASNTNLFASVDEATTPNDSDFIQSSITPGDKIRLGLSDPGTVVSAPMIVRFRAMKAGHASSVIGRVFQGTTQITQWRQSLTGTLTTYTYTLTSPEFTSITDFNNLFVEFEYASDWWLSGASIDLWFATSQYYESAAGGVGQDVTTYFTYSRASIGYATNADGTVTQFANDVLRITDLGLLYERNRTNSALWCRDLTNAAWTKTNVTAAKDQTGVDGSANSASSIVASAANGTVLQTITIASAQYIQSAYVKRITGTGTINMTMDNGSTWTVVAVTSGWTRVQIPPQTLANPVVGFRIVTNGDKIAVDFVQNEDTANGPVISSPILTTTTAATRAQDSTAFAGSLNTVISLDAASFVIDEQVPADGAGNMSSDTCFVGQVSVANPLLVANSGENQTVDVVGPGFPCSAFPVSKNTTGVKCGLTWSVAGRSIAGDGVTPSTDATDFGTRNENCVLGRGLGYNGSFILFRRFTAFNSRIADATLSGYTAP